MNSHHSESDPISLDCLWHLTFKLATEPGDDDRISLVDSRVGALCSLLRDHQAIVSVDDKPSLFVTMQWRAASGSHAFVNAEEALLKAVAEVGLGNFTLRDARLSDASGVPTPAHDLGSTAPTTELISMNDLADTMGVSKQRISAMYRADELPAPVAVIGRSPGWLPGQFSERLRSMTRKATSAVSTKQPLLDDA